MRLFMDGSSEGAVYSGDARGSLASEIACRSNNRVLDPGDPRRPERTLIFESGPPRPAQSKSEVTKTTILDLPSKGPIIETFDVVGADYRDRLCTRSFQWARRAFRLGFGIERLNQSSISSLLTLTKKDCPVLTKSNPVAWKATKCSENGPTGAG